MNTRDLHVIMVVCMVILVFAFSVSCGGDDDDARDGEPGDDDGDNDSGDDDDYAGDTEPPVINHVPVFGIREAGSPVDIAAGVADPSGVAEVLVFYRYQRDTVWSQEEMSESGGTYWGSIPGGDVGPPGVDYYIRATDASENANVSTAPEAAPASYYSFGATCTGTANIREIHNGNPLVPLPLPRFGDKVAVQFRVEEGTFTIYQVSQLFIKWFGGVCSDTYSAHIYSDSNDLPGYLLASGGAETVTEGLNCPNLNYHTFALFSPVTFYEGEKFWAVIQAEDAVGHLEVLLDNGSGHDEEDRCYGYTLGQWFSLDNVAMTRVVGCQWP